MPARLKKLVRARMQETGESYQSALRNVRAQAPHPPQPWLPSIPILTCSHGRSDWHICPHCTGNA